MGTAEKRTIKEMFPGPLASSKAKEAAVLASKYFRELAGYSGPLSVEEAEYDRKKGIWSITLGHLENPDAAFLTGLHNKSYKTFGVDLKAGQVISMKVRKF